MLTFSGHTLQTVFLQNWVIRQHPDLCRGCVHVRILKSFNRKAINSVEAYKMTSKSKPGNKSVQERSREHVSPTYAGQHFKMWQTDGQTDIKEWQTDRLTDEKIAFPYMSGCLCKQHKNETKYLNQIQNLLWE